MLLDAILASEAQARTNNMNQHIAAQNIAFQRDENRITREREDNAVQRRAADLMAAGLSQTLAAGNPASAQALTAPHNDYQYVSPLAKGLERVNIADSFLGLRERIEGIRKQQAEIKNINANTAGSMLNNEVFMNKFNADNALTLAQVDYTKKQLEVYDAELKLKEDEHEYNVKAIDKRINNLIADTNLKAANYDKVREDIKKTIKEEFKLDKEAELVVDDIVFKKLEAVALSMNIEYANSHGLPVNHIPSGLTGNITNAIDYASSQAQDYLGEGLYNFLFHTGDWLKDTGKDIWKNLKTIFE